MSAGEQDQSRQANEIVAAHAFGRLPKSTTLPASRVENAMKKIFVLLRARTGHDFSQSRPSMIHRRIEPRMEDLAGLQHVALGRYVPPMTAVEAVIPSAIATALLSEAGQMYAIATTERAIKGAAP